MTRKELLKSWTIDALEHLGGSSHWIHVAQHIWDHHEQDLRESGDLFYRWQYDLGWASKVLVDEGRLLKPGRGIWTLRQ